MKFWGILGLALLVFAGPSAEGLAPFVPRSFLTKQPRVRTNIESYSSNACAVQITRAERASGIPANLMQAIAKVESGKNNSNGDFVAWPWTVNAEGKSYYYKTKNEAVQAVKDMQARGMKSIDVGCMQVNLYHHPNAFKNLYLAFDPAQNVAYAAKFLKNLNDQHGDWNKAVAHYHSATPLYHIPYQKKVLARWDAEKNEDTHIRKAVYTPTGASGTPIVRRPYKRVAPRTLTAAASTNDIKPVAPIRAPVIHKVTRNGIQRVKGRSSSTMMAQASTRGTVRRIPTKR